MESPMSLAMISVADVRIEERGMTAIVLVRNTTTDFLPPCSLPDRLVRR